jgi:hypothetical protein
MDLAAELQSIDLTNKHDLLADRNGSMKNKVNKAENDGMWK